MVTASTTPISHITPDNDVVTAEVFIAAPRERVFQAISESPSSREVAKP
jgi:hypothetical protein